MSAPRISFLVPCHDDGRYLDEAVQSVLAQTCQDFEILVVDDGSTDPATVRLLDGYQRPRTTVLRSDRRRGLPGARNLALRQAGGELVSALDADDRLRPRFVEAILAAFDADPGLTFCSAWQAAFGAEEWEWRQERCDLATLLAENTVLPAAPVRREALLAVGGWDERMTDGYEDWDLWLSLVERGHRGHILPEVLFDYRRRADSMSAAIARDRELHLRLMRYLYAKHPPPEEQLWAAFLHNQRRGTQSLRRIRDAEGLLATWLEPQAVDLRAEVARLEARLARARRLKQPEVVPPVHGAEVDALAAELATARHEVHALRTSWSWRLTAPLRTCVDLARRLLPRSRP